MSDQADKAAENLRVWKASYSETGKTRGGPCVWLYNPKGEAVVLMFPQDRPEAEGVVSEIVNGLNASLIRSHTAPRELVEASEATAKALAQLMVAAVTLGLDETEPSISEVLERHKGVGAEMTKQIAIARSALSAQEPKVCPDCGGDGWVSETVQVDVDEYGDAIGEQIQVDCPKCEGTGVIKVKE